MNKKVIRIYSDGSCHTKLKIGAWAALIFIANEKIVLKSVEKDTTNNRMELLGVIESVKYILENKIDYEVLEIYSDSQYVVNLTRRKDKLKQQNFLTSTGKNFPNTDLVKILIEFIETLSIEFVKVIAHQKKGVFVNYNREVDILVRRIMRDKIRELASD